MQALEEKALTSEADEALAHVMRHEADLVIRSHAIPLVSKHSNASSPAVQSLIQLLAEDPSPAAKGLAIQTLSKMIMMNDQVYQALRRAEKEDGSLKIRETAKSAADDIYAKAENVILGGNAPETDLKQSILILNPTKTHTELVNGLIKLLAHSNPEIATAAEEALLQNAFIPPIELESQLVAALGHSNQIVRAKVVSILDRKKLTQANTFIALKKVSLEDTIPELREQAENALLAVDIESLTLGDACTIAQAQPSFERVVNHLISHYLIHKDSNLRLAAARCLSTLSMDKRLFEMSLKSFKNQDVDWGVVRVLLEHYIPLRSSIAGDDNISISTSILPLLESEDLEVRRRSADILKLIHPMDASIYAKLNELLERGTHKDMEHDLLEISSNIKRYALQCNNIIDRGSKTFSPTERAQSKRFLLEALTTDPQVARDVLYALQNGKIELDSETLKRLILMFDGATEYETDPTTSRIHALIQKNLRNTENQIALHRCEGHPDATKILNSSGDSLHFAIVQLAEFFKKNQAISK